MLSPSASNSNAWEQASSRSPSHKVAGNAIPTSASDVPEYSADDRIDIERMMKELDDFERDETEPGPIAPSVLREAGSIAAAATVLTRRVARGIVARARERSTTLSHNERSYSQAVHLAHCSPQDLIAMIGKAYTMSAEDNAIRSTAGEAENRPGTP